MFDYPIVLSGNTTYARLGLSPDVTDNDILDAKGEKLRLLNLRRQELEKRLAKVFEKFPRLLSAKSKLAALKKGSEKTDQTAYKETLSEIVELEKQAQQADPDYKKLETEIEQIDQKINEINLIKLENNEEREKYDLKTPPCILLKLDPFSAAVLSDPRTRLFHIRKALARFFEEKRNIHCFHPSDLTRRIFLSDYEYNPLLDEEVL
ncbi:hypothetical protein JW906_08970 [bacterium]|nr:hypothetical protein [bacterium]